MSKQIIVLQYQYQLIKFGHKQEKWLLLLIFSCIIDESGEMGNLEKLNLNLM